MKTPRAQLNEFFAKYAPEVRSDGKAVLVRMRKFLPGAVEMVYDNYNALVIGFGATERPSEAVFSLVFYPRYAILCFLRGAFELSDPHKVLQGGGKRIRHIRLPSAATLDEPAVQDLISQAIAVTLFRPGASVPGRLIIKSISAKQRPRRPA